MHLRKHLPGRVSIWFANSLFSAPHHALAWCGAVLLYLPRWGKGVWGRGVGRVGGRLKPPRVPPGVPPNMPCPRARPLSRSPADPSKHASGDPIWGVTKFFCFHAPILLCRESTPFRGRKTQNCVIYGSRWLSSIPRMYPKLRRPPRIRRSGAEKARDLLLFFKRSLESGILR